MKFDLLIKHKKLISAIFKIFVTLIFVIIINRAITADEIAVITGYLSPVYLILILLLSFLGLWFHVKRWQIILRYMNLDSSYSKAWKNILWGAFLAFITPGRVGELFRGVGTVEGDKKDAMFAVLLDKMFILSTVFVFGIIATVIQYAIFNITLPALMLKISVGIFLFSLILFILLYRGHLISENNKIAIYFNKVVTGVHRIFNPAGLLAIFYSLMAHLILILQTILLLQMFTCQGIFKSLLAASQAYAVMPFFAVSIAELGVREGAVSYFMNRAGILCSSELTVGSAALGMSILIVLVNLMIPAAIGLIWMLSGRDQKEEMSVARTD